jgi:hypothetical protein
MSPWTDWYEGSWLTRRCSGRGFAPPLNGSIVIRTPMLSIPRGFRGDANAFPYSVEAAGDRPGIAQMAEGRFHVWRSAFPMVHYPAKFFATLEILKPIVRAIAA